MTPQNKLILPIILISYAFVLSLGAMSITLDEPGGMSDCPFMTGHSICPMGILEHITTFQNVFKAVFPGTFLYLIILSILSLIYFSNPYLNINSPPKLQFFLRNTASIFIPNKLILAISDGRIQPKLFA